MTKSNKWLMILIYCIVGVLVLSTVILYIVPVSYRPEIGTPNAISITESSGGSSSILCSDDNAVERYNEINEEFENAFSESVLTGIFSGRIGTNSRIETYYKTNPTSEFSGYIVRFMFKTKQTVMLNGKEYNPPTNSSETIEFDEIVFELAQDKGFSTHYIYYVYQYQDTTNVERTMYYRQSIMCNFDDLYNLVSSYLSVEE